MMRSAQSISNGVYSHAPTSKASLCFFIISLGIFLTTLQNREPREEKREARERENNLAEERMDISFYVVM